jgi:DNA-directed RNA polymerase specialized sigma24 family protein
MNSSVNRPRNLNASFLQSDYLVVRRAMDELPLLEKLAVEMRFFHNFSISEIARLLRVGWTEAEELIESALAVLREHCLSDPRFSRSAKVLQAA